MSYSEKVVLSSNGVFLDILRHEDFERAVEIILEKNPRYSREHYMYLLSKLQCSTDPREDLTVSEIEDIVAFLEDKNVRKIWDKIYSMIWMKIWLTNFSYLVKDFFWNDLFDKTKSEIVKLLWLDACRMKVIIDNTEQEILVDKSDLSINSEWWSIEYDTYWMRYKINPDWDIIEIIEWGLKWVQFFKISAAIREAKKQWKTVLTSDIWDQILKNWISWQYFLDLNLICWWTYNEELNIFEMIWRLGNYLSVDTNSGKPTSYFHFISDESPTVIDSVVRDNRLNESAFYQVRCYR